jgi:hypothetical protein
MSSRCGTDWPRLSPELTGARRVGYSKWFDGSRTFIARASVDVA